MDDLLGYFATYKKSVDELLPRFPEEDDAARSLIRIFSRINRFLAPDSHPFASNQGVTTAFAILVVNWMRGDPLALLISKRERREQERLPEGDDVVIAPIIRSTMEEVEKIARFLAPKYVSCYIDLLRHFLTSTGRADVAARVPDLSLSLKFGAYKQTQLSLMSMGFSRAGAMFISDLIPQADLDEAACGRWLLAHDLGSLNLPAAIVREAERHKARLKPR